MVPESGCSRPAEDPQQGRLAPAARAQQRRQGAARQVDGHVPERGEVAEVLRDAGHADHRWSSRGRSRMVSRSVRTATTAIANAAAYAACWSKLLKRSSTKS